MKIGVILESFRLPLEQSLDLAAEYGIDGVQIYARNQRLTARTPGELRDFAKLFSSRGLEVAAVCGDLGGHGFRSFSDNEARIAETFRIFEAMRELDCRVLTTHIGTVPRDAASAAYTEMAAALRRVGEFAEKLGMFNCGLMAISLDAATIDEIFKTFAGTEATLTTDIEGKTFTISNGATSKVYPFTVGEFDLELVKAGGWVNYADSKY